jgi:hypothetical protein
MDFLGIFSPVISKIIDSVFPDEAKRNEAKAKLLSAENTAKMEEINASLSAIIAEAKSSDKWTSRARPSFLYVVYAMLLASLPMGMLAAFDPTTAFGISQGMRDWLAAIPENMWWLFGAGYLGYTGARTYDKAKILGK